MARTLTELDFTAYATSQFLSAEQVLALHNTAGVGGLCQCGRSLPCTVASKWVHHRDHYAQRLAEANQAQQPLTATDVVGPSAVQPHDRPMWVAREYVMSSRETHPGTCRQRAVH